MSALIHEFEPLNWLVSSLFTDEFLNNKPNFDPFEFPDTYDSEKDEKIYMNGFEEYQTYQGQIDSFVTSNLDASDCVEHAIKAIKIGNIKIPDSEISDTGEVMSPLGYEYVNANDFYIWAENSGYPIPIDTSFLRDKNFRNLLAFQNEFPEINFEQFENKAKEPMWYVFDGILYLLGHRQRQNAQDNEGHKANLFFKQSYLASKLLNYAKDAFLSKVLEPISINDDIILNTVEPKKFVTWAQSLPLDLPIFKNSAIDSRKQDCATLDMLLRDDVIDKSCSDQDISAEQKKLKRKRKTPFHEDVRRAFEKLKITIAEIPSAHEVLKELKNNSAEYCFFTKEDKNSLGKKTIWYKHASGDDATMTWGSFRTIVSDIHTGKK